MINLKEDSRLWLDWLAQLKTNRLVSQDYQDKVPISRLALDEAGTIARTPQLPIEWADLPGVAIWLDEDHLIEERLSSALIL